MTGIFELLFLSFAALMLLVMFLVVARCCCAEVMDLRREWRRYK